MGFIGLMIFLNVCFFLMKWVMGTPNLTKDELIKIEVLFAFISLVTTVAANME